MENHFCSPQPLGTLRSHSSGRQPSRMPLRKEAINQRRVDSPEVMLRPARKIHSERLCRSDSSPEFGRALHWVSRCPRYPGGDPIGLAISCECWNSAQSTLITARGSPNNTSAVASTTRVSPVPVGPRNNRFPTGRPQSLSVQKKLGIGRQSLAQLHAAQQLSALTAPRNRAPWNSVFSGSSSSVRTDVAAVTITSPSDGAFSLH
jgi:hypothetical protein